jgi:hypothetical protein
LDPLPDEEVYTIVPATFEPKKKVGAGPVLSSLSPALSLNSYPSLSCPQGPFFLTVTADADFSFVREPPKGSYKV